MANDEGTLKLELELEVKRLEVEILEKELEIKINTIEIMKIVKKIKDPEENDNKLYKNLGVLSYGIICLKEEIEDLEKLKKDLEFKIQDL